MKYFSNLVLLGFAAQTSQAFFGLGLPQEQPAQNVIFSAPQNLAERGVDVEEIKPKQLQFGD